MFSAALLTLLLAATPVDFDTEILPVLTRAGCNAGACHGAAAGRGGLRLSLFGGDPAADYRAIVQELEGRRVNLARPERSLLLLKPTWELDHVGGQRFEADSPQAVLVAAWIRAGAQRLNQRRLVRLRVEPAQATVDQVPAIVPLAVTAEFSDDSSGRVADTAVFTPADPASTEVDSRGYVKVLRPGRHAIVVRYLTEVVAVQITAPHAHPPLDAANQPRGNWIDDEVNATLAALRLPLSPRADNAALLRRVTLDLTGRLPTPERIRAFVADPSEAKFAAEVDRLLASPQFAEFWTYKFARWLRIRTGPNDLQGTQTYHAWLRGQIESGRPANEWAQELLTAMGDSHQQGPANFHRSATDARGQAELVAETLLGIRLRCANCHNHPLDRWTQDDYHGLAAIFSRIERGQVVTLKPGGEVIHPANGEPAVPRIPGEKFLPANADNRAVLAEWLTSREHRRFAKAQVNRLWHAMFGRGLIEPIDDLRDTNPPTHPELLDRLADDFVTHEYDLRHTLRLLANSAAYQRSDRAQPAAKNDDRCYSHALARPLSPEVLVDAVADASGIPTDFQPRGDNRRPPRNLPQIPPGTRAIALFSPELAAPALGPLTECTTLRGCPIQGESAATLDDLDVQLHWLNGPLVNERLADGRGEFARLANSNLSTPRLVEEYYLRTLSRLPTEIEARFWQKTLAGTSRHKKCEDFAWSLLSSREFATNH